MRTLTFTGIGFIIILVVCATLITPGVTNGINIDFQNYYGTAGMTSQEIIASDPAYQEILSLSIFHDVSTEISHASSRHGDDQSLYKQCMDGNNTLMGFINPDNNHCVEVMSSIVNVGGNRVERFIVRVVKNINGRYYEITAFSDEWEYFYEVEQYLLDGGYMQMW